MNPMSPSQYGMYKRCPKQYEFRYINNIKLPPNGVMLKGTSVHKGVEIALKKYKEVNYTTLPDKNEILSCIADNFEKGKVEVSVWDEPEGRLKDEALRLYNVYHQLQLPKTRPIEVEFCVVKKVQDIPLTGIIDLIDDNKYLEIVDLKTSSKSWSQTEVNKEPQFTFYTLLTDILAVRVDNLIINNSSGISIKNFSSVRTKQDQLILLEDINDTIELIKKGIFPKTSIDFWGCNEKWCGYWNQCRGKKYG